jgi:hypothetical protein
MVRGDFALADKFATKAFEARVDIDAACRFWMTPERMTTTVSDMVSASYWSGVTLNKGDAQMLLHLFKLDLHSCAVQSSAPSGASKEAIGAVVQRPGDGDALLFAAGQAHGVPLSVAAPVDKLRHPPTARSISAWAFFSASAEGHIF